MSANALLAESWQKVKGLYPASGKSPRSAHMGTSGDLGDPPPSPCLLHTIQDRSQVGTSSATRSIPGSAPPPRTSLPILEHIQGTERVAAAGDGSPDPKGTQQTVLLGEPASRGPEDPQLRKAFPGRETRLFKWSEEGVSSAGKIAVTEGEADGDLSDTPWAGLGCLPPWIQPAKFQHISEHQERLCVFSIHICLLLPAL